MSATHRRVATSTVPAPVPVPTHPPFHRLRSLAGLPSRLVAWFVTRIDPFDATALSTARRQPPVEPELRQAGPWRGPVAPGARHAAPRDWRMD